MVGRHNGSIIAFCLHVTSNSYYKKHIAIHSQVQGQQYRTLTASKRLVAAAAASGLPKVIFLAEAVGEGGKFRPSKSKPKVKPKVWYFVLKSIRWAYSDIDWIRKALIEIK